MNTAIQLTDAELNLIEANRAAEQAAQDAADAEKRRKEAEKVIHEQEQAAARLAVMTKRIAAVNELAEKLSKADKTGVFMVSFKTHEGIAEKETIMSFNIGDKTYDVDFNEITKPSSSRFRPNYSTGVYQMSVHGKFTDYKTRNYKSPASLYKKVVEFKEIADAQAVRKNRELNLAKDTVAALEVKYPTAKITAYEPNKWNSLSSKYYITYHVVTTSGTVSFTSSYTDGYLKMVVYGFEAKTTTIKQSIADLILAS